jgi:hypothetical protein
MVCVCGTSKEEKKCTLVSVSDRVSQSISQCRACTGALLGYTSYCLYVLVNFGGRWSVIGGGK